MGIKYEICVFRYGERNGNTYCGRYETNWLIVAIARMIWASFKYDAFDFYYRR